MKRLSKIVMLLIIIFFIESISYQTFALDLDKYRISTPTISEAQDFVDIASLIIGTIRNISIVVSVIALMIIGIKYMLGSVEEKANYKQTMLPYIVGCFLAIAGTTLVSLIFDTVFYL